MICLVSDSAGLEEIPPQKAFVALVKTLLE